MSNYGIGLILYKQCNPLFSPAFGLKKNKSMITMDLFIEHCRLFTYNCFGEFHMLVHHVQK